MSSPKALSSSKGKTSWQSIKRVLDYLKGHEKKLILALVFNILVTVLTIYSMRLMGTTLDRYLHPFDSIGLGKTALFLLGLFSFTSLASYLETRITAVLAQGLAFELREDMFNKLMRLPIRYFDENSNGDIMSRFTNDVDTINTTLSESITAFLEAGVMLVGTIVAMYTLSPRLTAYSMVIIPLTLITTRLMVSLSKKFFRAYQARLGALNGYIEEQISAQKMLYLYHMADRQMEGFSKQNNELTKAYQKAQSLSALMPLMSFINNFSYLLVTVLGSLMILKGEGLTVGILFSFLLYMRRFARPLNNLASLFNSIQSGVAGAERIWMLMDEGEEEETHLLPYSYQGGEIVFEHVSFGYDEEDTVSDLCFTVKAGHRVALVGATGSGKTTIASLLTRLYDYDSGAIYLDGQELKKLSRASLRAQIAYVPQDTFLFSESLLSNLRYGNPKATREDVEAMVKRLGMEPLVKRFADGLDTVLENNGAALSQGQRQLIGICRAALASPPILILDEATSNIDTQTEELIQQALDQLTQGRTSIVIAHRLSTIRAVDEILVLDDGCLIEAGTHKELLHKQGHYAKMIQLSE